MQMIAVVALGLVFTMFGSTAVVLGQEQQTFEAPTYTVGDTWEFVRRDYASFTVTVVEVKENGLVMTSTSRPGILFYADRHGTITKIEGEPGKVAPIAFLANGWKWLSFPLHVGKKWSFDAQGSNAHFTIDITVKKLTTVRTKGGTFEALQIDACWRNNDNRWSDCGYRYWYSPAAKYIVKRETPGGWTAALSDSDHELVSHILGGAMRVTEQR